MKDTTLCYIERDGKYLMLLRDRKQSDPNDGKWIGVGGKLEEGESQEECARREILEETGLKADRLEHFGDVFFHSDLWEDEIMRLYLVTEYAGELTDCDEGELHWIEKDKIFDLNLWDGDRIFLKYLINNRHFHNMTLTYQGDHLCRCTVDGSEEELIDVCNEDGTPAGYVASRDYIHWKGLWHSTVHIWIVRSSVRGKPELLLQLRTAGKRLYPSCWDISSAGHIPAGEDALHGAVREINEELGLRVEPEELKYIGTMVMTYDDDVGEGYHDREHCRIYVLQSHAEISEMTLQESEVQQVMWMEYDEIVKAMADGSLKHCLFEEELDFIRPYIL